MFGIYSKTKGWLLCEYKTRADAEATANSLNDKLMKDFKKLQYVPKEYLYIVEKLEGCK